MDVSAFLPLPPCLRLVLRVPQAILPALPFWRLFFDLVGLGSPGRASESRLSYSATPVPNAATSFSAGEDFYSLRELTQSGGAPEATYSLHPGKSRRVLVTPFLLPAWRPVKVDLAWNSWKNELTPDPETSASMAFNPSLSGRHAIIQSNVRAISHFCPLEDTLP